MWELVRKIHDKREMPSLYFRDEIYLETSRSGLDYPVNLICLSVEKSFESLTPIRRIFLSGRRYACVRSRALFCISLSLSVKKGSVLP